MQWVDTQASLTEGRGTLLYMDPRAAQEHNNKYTDMYSFCTLASEVLTGRKPPTTDWKTIMKIKSNTRPPFPDCLSKRLRECLLSGFEWNFKKRASWEDIIKALGMYIQLQLYNIQHFQSHCHHVF